MLSVIRSKLDSHRVVAVVITLLGLIGMAYSLHIQPQDFNIIFDTARWICSSIFSNIVFFSGLAGLRRKKLTSFHLKVIDLIWVSASAVAVALAAVQATQISADTHRILIKRNIEQSRNVAVTTIGLAYREECLLKPMLSVSQCENLRRLGISLDAGGYISPAIVGAVCPRPIRIDAPPANFGPALIQGCISAGYAAYAAEDPVLIDESNVNIWRLYAGFWPELMILLVSLRVAKSAAEVFWGVK